MDYRAMQGQPRKSPTPWQPANDRFRRDMRRRGLIVSAVLILLGALAIAVAHWR
jgi:hypothetical protein